MSLKPIETNYKGYRMRSRLEARWGVFFDTLGVKWEYEKEGYDLGDAGWYLPDFYLPEYRWWIEIKPTNDLVGDENKYHALASATGESVLVLAGQPWPEEYSILVYGQGHELSLDESEQGKVCNQWALRSVTSEFPNLSVIRQFDFGKRCWALVIPKEQEKYDDSVLFNWPATDNKFCSDVDSILVEAYTAARQARFEHRENLGLQVEDTIEARTALFFKWAAGRL